VEAVSRSDVGERPVHGEHFGQVVELADAGVQPPRAAFGGGFQRGDGSGEDRRPGVERVDSCGLKQVGGEVVGHDPHLGQGVGDTRCRWRR